MNYRHQYHAGNFADVVKHALLVQLIRALQKKEKGLFVLDTHAGRGCYDLSAAAQGDSLAREPEWPAGIGRLWTAEGLPPALADYVALVRQFDRERGGAGTAPRYYPGSPWIERALLRAQDRLALCELQAEEQERLAAEFFRVPRTSTQALDGYVAIRAMLPPPERRALVLIDPPFEAQQEFTAVMTALTEGLARLPGGTFAVWYPLTARAGSEELAGEIRARRLPPTVALELTIAGEASAPKLRGCGLLVVNPPWQFESVAAPLLQALAPRLAQAKGAAAEVRWLVPER